MLLDVTTLHMIMFMSQLLMGGYLAVLYADNRLEKALLTWAITNVICSVTTVLFLGQGVVSPLISVVVPSLGFSGFVAGYLLGLWQFMGRPIAWQPIAALLATQAGAVSYFAVVEPVLWVRFTINAITTVSLCLLICWEIRRARAQTQFKSFSLLLAVFMIHGLVFLAAGVVTLIQRPTGDYMVLSSGSAGFAILEALLMFFLASICVAVLIPEKLKASLKQTAITDGLTGLGNRFQFMDQLRQALDRRGGQPGTLAVLYIDLDGFKEVNDNNGHHIGDALLVEVARALVRQAGPGALVARMGGDEFAVLLENDDAVVLAQARAELILTMLRQPHQAAGYVAMIDASVGIAVNSDLESSAVEMMRQADIAMYAAKRSGRGQLRFFTADLDAEVVERTWIKNELIRALSDDSLALAFQPKYRVGYDQTPQLVGVEALVRWTHPDRGPISPSQFIPVAEYCGLIEELGAWVLRNAVRAVSAWPDLTLAVNLSPRQFANNDIVSLVERVLRDSAMQPERLELEITEGVLLSADERVHAALLGLRRLGVKLALDDFGSGYSSLSYLRDYGFDTLKIDRGFVSALATSDQARVITQAVIALGQGLNLEVIAEGVETDEELELLMAMGCRMVQGYLLGKPLPAKVVDGLTRQRASA